MLAAVGLHQICNVAFAADINANIKCVHCITPNRDIAAVNRLSTTHDSVASATSLIGIRSERFNAKSSYCRRSKAVSDKQLTCSQLTHSYGELTNQEAVFRLYKEELNLLLLSL